METIRVERTLTDNTIRFKLHVPRRLRKYFLDDECYVQYDRRIDLRDVPGSILSIPMVGLLAPIAWAVGASVRVDELDATYLQSLAKVKEIYQAFYTHFSFAGEIEAESVVHNRFGGERTGMLFSGGVDSMTSYLRHREMKPDLISIWGLLDLPPFEKTFWSRMWADICNLADREEVEAFQIRTDMIRNVNHELLSRQFGLRWFGQAAHGPFVLGLCAPVTVSRGIGTTIVAASYTSDHKVELGFYPPVDNSIAWADAGVFHDGFELSRQQKLKYLCRPEHVGYMSHLRVCWDSAWKTNCGNCEKCFRTIAGLVAEGVDPNTCNFNMNDRTLPYLRDCFCTGKMALREGQIYMWRDIQNYIPERIDSDIRGSREFLTWLRDYDLSQHRASRLRRFLWVAFRLYRNKRTNLPSLRRKAKCYCYILLARARIL